MQLQTRFAASLATVLLVSTTGTALALGGPQISLGQASTQVSASSVGSKKVDVSVDLLDVLQRSIRIGHADPSRVMHVSVSMPPADSAALEAFAEAVSDPNSPEFRKFITPEEVGARFGLPTARVQAIADWLTSQGINVTLVAKNRMAILCEGTVAQFENAFGTTIDSYSVDPILAPEVEGGNTQFIAPSTRLQAPAAIAGDILDVFGLESYTKPQPRVALTPTQTRGLYNAASIYNSSMRGEGRVCAISNFDGYRLTNVPLYYSYYGLPTPAAGANSNVHVVAVGTAAGTGTAAGEGDLDIQMVLGMAPLCEFYIYDSTNDLVGVLTREANDNLADVISESYGWNIQSTTATAAHNQHLAMSAQGITYVAASGDYGTNLEPYSYPNYEPEVLQVGGTTATVNTSNVRTSEVGWSGSGGGWSTKAVSFNTRPTWQAGTGVPTTINYRMSPDVSLHASGGSTGAYPFYFNGARNSGSVGTSFASPVLCGQLALAQQKLISLNSLTANSAGKQRFGRMQNVIYAQNGRTDVWYDVTSGSNGTLLTAINGVTTSSCTAKFDLVTGWGAMNIDAFVASQTVIQCPADLNGNRAVEGSDLGILLAYWGAAGAGDLNGDGVTDGADLGTMLAAWGTCP